MTGDIRIAGTTRLCAIIGDPISQVRSPETFTTRFASAGIDAICIPVHVPAERFDSIVPALLSIPNVDGVLVTVPFKARMVPFAARLGATAQTVGAVNALRREGDGSWTGDMFDGIGFVRGAKDKQQRIRGRRVALFGAGGAGSAIACALADAGVQSIAIIDADGPKAAALVERMRSAFPDCSLSTSTALPRDVDMVVNASPVGMKPDDGLPGEIGRLDSNTLVGDVVITPTPTAIIRHAMQYGCPWVEGREMHAGQADAIMDFLRSSLIAGASSR